MQATHDLIIIGGGCAGLSLATRLAAHPNTAPRTLILEPRPRYTNDRTWCFWETPGTHATHLVTYRWNTMQVASNQRSLSVNCSQSPYSLVPAATFYEHATTSIAAAPRIDLRLAEPVRGLPRHERGLWHVSTSLGHYRAPVVIDTRPPRLARTAGPILWQSFAGAEVETEADVFDPQSMTLMDFRTAPHLSGPHGTGRHPARQSQRIQFVYMLPTTQRRALIEVTEFSPLPFTEANLRDDLTRALHDVCGRHVCGRHVCGKARPTILRTEHGVLPMGLPARATIGHPSTASTYITAGLSAGGARPCTGYAFQRIQRWAESCSQAILAGQLPHGHPPDPLWMRGMDLLFLNVLRAHPHLAPSLFVDLFSGTSSRHVIRFLSDQAGPTDVAQVIRSLPARLFVNELLSITRSTALRWQENLVS